MGHQEVGRGTFESIQYVDDEFSEGGVRRLSVPFASRPPIFPPFWVALSRFGQLAPFPALPRLFRHAADFSPRRTGGARLPFSDSWTPAF